MYSLLNKAFACESPRRLVLGQLSETSASIGKVKAELEFVQTSSWLQIVLTSVYQFFSHSPIFYIMLGLVTQAVLFYKAFFRAA